jgi:hypothetical protein
MVSAGKLIHVMECDALQLKLLNESNVHEENEMYH